MLARRAGPFLLFVGSTASHPSLKRQASTGRQKLIPSSAIVESHTSLDDKPASSDLVASSQGKKKSMAQRSGQAGTVVVKGRWWTGRYYEDVPGQISRRRKSIPIGLKEQMTKPEARRKLRAMLEEIGVNTVAHLERSLTQFRCSQSTRTGGKRTFNLRINRHLLTQATTFLRNTFGRGLVTCL